MSNRATSRNVVQQLVFAYENPENKSLAQHKEYRFLELRPLDKKRAYTNTMFEE